MLLFIYEVCGALFVVCAMLSIWSTTNRRSKPEQTSINQADRRQMRQESIRMASMAGMIIVIAVAIIATIYEAQITNFLMEVVGRIMPGLTLPGLTPI